MEFEKIITWMDWATIIFAFVTMILSFCNIWQRKKDKDKIEIYIQKNDQKIRLKTYMIRKNFTRAEVFGMLGALDKDSSFKIKYTSNADFIENIFNIQKGKQKELVIKIDENDKFDYDM